MRSGAVADWVDSFLALAVVKGWFIRKRACGATVESMRRSIMAGGAAGAKGRGEAGRAERVGIKNKGGGGGVRFFGPGALFGGGGWLVVAGGEAGRLASG